MEITYLGHAGIHLATGTSRVVIDPFISPNEHARAAGLNLASLDVDDLLLTHGHEDHVADAPVLAARAGVHVIANYEVAMWLQGKGAHAVLPMNHGGVLHRPYGKVRMVNAVHSSTLPDGTPGGNPAGFIIEAEGLRIYHAGDTALTMDMELIGRYWTPDLACLPVGDVFTMGPEDALAAAEMLECDRVLALHYDTFPPIALDKDRKLRAQAAFAEIGKELIFLQIGEQITA